MVKTGGVNSGGIDLLVTPLAKYDCWHFTNQLSVWYQPHILKNDTAQTNTNKCGFAEFLGAYYKVNSSLYAFGGARI